MNLLKYLANDLKLSVVVVGTSDALLALETDAQRRSRFKPFEIPRWRECDEFRRLLGAFELVLPLRRASNLARKAVVEFLLAASGGLTGEVSRLLNEAAELAIVDATERITIRHLEHGGTWQCDPPAWPVAPRPFAGWRQLPCPVALTHQNCYSG